MTQSLDIICALLEQTRAFGASAADAVMFETLDVSTSRRLGKPEGLERSESKAIGLRAFSGNRQAIASSTDTGKEALKALAERVVAMAKATPPDPDSTLAASTLHPKTIPDLELFDGKEPEPAWLEEQCAKAEDAAMAVKGITNSEGAEANYHVGNVSLATINGSIGFAQTYPSSHFSLSVSVIAGEGVDMQRDYDYTSTHHRADLMPADAIGKNAAQLALKRLNPRKVATCQVPIVFEPRISKNMLAILAGAISGSSVARGSSFLKDDLGKDIFSKHVTIIDDPHIKRGLASKPFDAEGVANRKLALVEGGVLKSWLLDIRSANKLKMNTTGHATRGLASPPSPSATNLYMQKGTLSPKELMSDIKSGFYVTETFGMGVNTVTGDYSQGASGYWIENGEIAYPVSEITIAGRLQDMFKQLTPANDLTFRYSTNAPTLRVESMTVAGT